MLSKRFIERVKLSSTPAYQIAITAGIHPSTLSKLLHGAEQVYPDDPRVLALASVLGLRACDCFSGPTRRRASR